MLTLRIVPYVRMIFICLETVMLNSSQSSYLFPDSLSHWLLLLH